MFVVEVGRYGGPEVLEMCCRPAPVPGGTDVLIDVNAAGINYADTHVTENTYLSRSALPFVPGIEVVGHAPSGQRVVALLSGGGYAELAVARREFVFDVPDALADGQALALIVQGNTAWHLLHTCARVRPGEVVVVHAAAGGVGSLAVQLAKEAGARVIAVASTEVKRKVARGFGADKVVDADCNDLTASLLDANDGEGVDVVLEMVGGETFRSSFSALGRFGRLVTYGAASRVAPASLNPGSLMQGSRSLIGFLLTDLTMVPGALKRSMTELLGLAQDNKLQPLVGHEYPFSHAKAAHEDMRARRTIGKLLLRPLEET